MILTELVNRFRDVLGNVSLIVAYQRPNLILKQNQLFPDDEPDQPPEGEEEKVAVTYFISNDVHFTTSRMAALACIKRGGVIEADKSIHSQLRLINFSEGSPYETLHSFISKSLAPYFKSYVKESGRADRDGDKVTRFLQNLFASFLTNSFDSFPDGTIRRKEIGRT